MKLSSILVVYTLPRTKEQKSTLDLVKKIIKKYTVKHKFVNRDRLHKSQFESIGLVVAVGGDGTYLRTAQFIHKQLLFGVNADAKNKEGFFMKSDKRNFEERFKKIIKNNFKIRKLRRLEAYVDGKKVSTLALNEFFIGARKSYHAAKYTIYIDGKKERQKSSGILITTPAGSYAWARSCYNRTISLDSDKYQFAIREPYEGEVFKNYKLKRGLLNKNKKITIVSEMLDGVLVADSVSKEYNFKNGSEATIRLSNKLLNAIWSVD